MIRAIRFIRSTTRKEREDAFEGWWAVFVVGGLFAGAWIATPANAAERGTALSSASRIEPASSLDQRLQSHFAGEEK